MDLFRQTRTLAAKTLSIILTRHAATTIYSALVLPALACVYLGLGQNFNQPNAEFGIGSPRDIRPLADALAGAAASTGRRTVALVNGGHSGGAIDGVIDSLAETVAAAGQQATRLASEEELSYLCRPSPRGTSSCFGAVVFRSSPREGEARIWNYTLRADPALGSGFRAARDDNDAPIYVLPLQHAVDAAIAGSSLPAGAREYGYTAETEDERRAGLRRAYQSSFIDYLGVGFAIALIGVCYHMPGLIATERESGMSQLIDAMMPVSAAWHRQFARLASHHGAFTLAYMPGWLIAAIICRVMIWRNTSYGTLVVFFLLGGLAITSMSLLAASFFRKAQLSGVVTTVAWIALALLAQALPAAGTAAVAILSALFTPCTFVFFITSVARYEREGQASDLARPPPGSPWNLPPVVLWIFLIAQALLYPVLAAYLERALHGVTTGVRHTSLRRSQAAAAGDDVVRVDNITKVYRPGLLRRFFSFVSSPRPEVVAVDGLTLTAKKGQILALLGANGSGKSTSLDIIAGITNFTNGNVSVDASGGLGVAPQKNVLWDELTVEEHIGIFNQLKSPSKQGSREETRVLIDAIGLGQKAQAQAKTLSGGQKRKLQLGMMLTGGSSVCCVDEVSSGLDPLSRKKVWDILLSERGKRTIIMTTHFLDEADLLADNIAILSKGTLRAEGPSAHLKNTLGAGYRIHVLDTPEAANQQPPLVAGVECKAGPGAVTYVAPSSSLAADVIGALEARCIPYKFSGPTIEDVFLNLADEARSEKSHGYSHRGSPISAPSEEPAGQDKTLGTSSCAQGLLPGRPVGLGKQIGIFLRKRFVILRSNWIPYVAAFLIPIIAAAVTQILVRGEHAVGCSPFIGSNVADLFKPLRVLGGAAANSDASLVSNSTLKLVDSIGSFDAFIQHNRSSVVPGGWWLGDDAGSVPTLAYRADNFSMHAAVMSQSFLNTMIANETIAATYSAFDSSVAPSTARFLQLAVYFALACSVFPGLFGLYPSTERRMQIRALQYSSGARVLPVWAAHLVFDFSIMLVSMAVAATIFDTTSDVWYHLEYLFPIFMLYGLVSILVAYLFSLVCSSSLAAFAATSVFQGVGFAVYLVAFLYIQTYSPSSATDRNVLIGHWIISAVFPSGSLIRAFFVALNTFSASCDGDQLRAYPGAILAYGGPVLYLSVQAIFLFLLVLWLETGGGKYTGESTPRSKEVDDAEVASDVAWVDDPSDNTQGLRVAHLTRAFGKHTAVDNVTFRVQHGEIFALLGPNGAGKSTTISLIRGDIAPGRRGGDVFIENASIVRNRTLARQNLGVCPQFDAIDSMTVVGHLEHFARIRGIADVDRQVRAVLQAVGLDAYADVLAHTLSGGNKRKLSLAMALTGNPSVILLDEPSSGLDAAAKRIMWRTLESIAPGRSILLTTHSMEEADALASRAGIMARRMLAIGAPDSLRRRFGDALHVHLVSKTAPHSSSEEMDRLRSWVLGTFPGAEIEQETLHGQLRFAVPPSAVLKQQAEAAGQGAGTGEAGSAMGRLLIILEENKNALGILHHSVSPTTLTQVFLAIVGQQAAAEEDCRKGAMQEKPWWRKNIWGF
ncbi:ABC transporter [Hirsutella rhossiliensis]|uniref:ABC transporter domain-containing protein n=1 Tax=Hirsutella rhossiliensis TaxID=111463 RepID=A0A9P8SFI7_9HYPO|nr:ABC transporter domain-containing protein [Hirsutella rhossiliensis]KAH0960978.1 ABC transporter domain-containing protein [Hirsutella rhossiliensis]